MMSALVLALMLTALPQAPSANAGYSYAPGVTILWEFPDLPATLHAHVFPDVAQYNPPRLSIRIPDNYRADRTYPMAIFMGGNHGGNGMTNPDFNAHFAADTICVYLPLFKREVEPLAEDNSNQWRRVYIGQDDADIIWQAFEPMIEKVYELVPNIDRERTFMGGFSNGAHTTAVLLNRPDAANEIRRLVGHFYLIEGGNKLEQFDVLKDAPILFMQGGKHERQPLPELCERAMQAGVPAQCYVMVGAGHEMTEAGWQTLRKWIADPSAKVEPAPQTQPATQPQAQPTTQPAALPSTQSGK